MKEKITLDNAHTFSIPLSEHPIGWKFIEDDKKLSPEYSDQIFPLHKEASKFLWKFQQDQSVLGDNIEKCFKEKTELSYNNDDFEKINKWLYNSGIPFKTYVFRIPEPQWGFILTWKMVIKFWEVIFFGSDETIWDKTLNWRLDHDHNDYFEFGKHRIFSAEDRSKEIEFKENFIRSIIERDSKKSF
jgi:hypothetical protein